MLKPVMLYNAYEDAALKLIKAAVKCFKTNDLLGYAKQRFLLAMLRVNYYEQFVEDTFKHDKMSKFIKEQIDNSWNLVGVVRDYCDEVGFDWKNCEVPELHTYFMKK